MMRRAQRAAKFFTNVAFCSMFLVFLKKIQFFIVSSCSQKSFASLLDFFRFASLPDFFASLPGKKAFASLRFASLPEFFVAFSLRFADSPSVCALIKYIISLYFPCVITLY